MEFITIILAILSLIWFIAVLVLLNKITRYLRLNLEAQTYGGWYIGMPVRHIETGDTYTIVKIEGDVITVDSYKIITMNGVRQQICDKFRRSELMPY